jgi:hypothetical protein
MARVPGARFGFAYGCHPGGAGIVTVRSVSLSGAISSPSTPSCSRYADIGTGGSALAEVVVVVVVDKIDW